MRELITRRVLLLVGALLIGWTSADIVNKPNAMSAVASQPAAKTSEAGRAVQSVDAAVLADPNPLLAVWEGPYGGVPPFDRVRSPLQAGP
jgi:hypothetical protein